MQTARESHGTGCSTKRRSTHSAQRELAMIAIRDRHRPSFKFLILRGHQWVIHHTVGQHSKSKDRYRRGNRGRYGVGESQIHRDGDWKCRHKKKKTEHLTRGNISGHKVVGYNGNNDSLDQYTKRKAVAQRVTGRNGDSLQQIGGNHDHSDWGLVCTPHSEWISADGPIHRRPRPPTPRIS